MTRESPRVRRLPAASLIGAAVGMLLAARSGQLRIPPQNKRDEDLKPVARIQHQQPPGPDKPTGPGRSIRAVPLHCRYGIGSCPPRVSDQAERSQPQLSSAFRTPMRVPSGL